ncbi:MAG: LysM repeat protein [Rhodothermales bacterium]|jgi:LysM repeat protein
MHALRGLNRPLPAANGPFVAPMRVTARLAARTTVFLVLLSFTALAAFGQARQTYTVRAGDTLYRIAVNNKLSIEQIQVLNGMSGTVIRVGQVLRLAEDGQSVSPAADSAATPEPARELATDSTATTVTLPPAPAPPAPAELDLFPDVPPARHIQAVFDSTGAISHGEIRLAPQQTLFDLSFALGVPVDTLAALNTGYSNVLADGAPVRVPARFAASSYRVKAGDTLYRVAAEHGISLGELRLANPDLADAIRVGQRLRIPSTESPAEPQMPVVIAEGSASVYPERFAGRLMASGLAYDETRHTVAHPALPFGTVVIIENAETGVRTFAEVADRMPVTTEFVVEVSKAVAEAINLQTGKVRVRIIHASN